MQHEESRHSSDRVKVNCRSHLRIAFALTLTLGVIATLVVEANDDDCAPPPGGASSLPDTPAVAATDAPAQARTTRTTEAPAAPPGPSTARQPDGDTPQDPQQPSQQDPIPPSVRSWCRQPFSPSTFTAGIAFARDPALAEPARFMVIDRLHSWRHDLAPEQQHELLAAATRLATGATEPALLRAQAVGVIASAAITMEEAAVPTDRAAHTALATTLLIDTANPELLRASAATALGVLHADDASPILREVLAGDAPPELTRSACLSLLRIEGHGAFEPIRRMLDTTDSEAAFGTAAFALGEMQSVEALAALVSSRDRFRDSGAADAAMVHMESVILDVLSQPENPHIIAAILATEHLWKDGQSERYLPRLRALSQASQWQTRRAAVDRIMDHARHLPLDDEKRELRALLAAIAGVPKAERLVLVIRERLEAQPLQHSTSTTPTQRRPR